VILPKYYFSNDFKEFENLFINGDHTIKKFSPHSIMSSQGETFTSSFYIQKGMLKVAIGHEEGQEKTVSFHGEGTVFPFCINEERYQLEYSIVVTAVSDVTAISFSDKTARKLVLAYPTLALRVAENFCRQINLLYYDNVSQSFDDSDKRICTFLYLYDSNLQSKDHRIQLTQEEIASIIGIRRVQVARVFRSLREEKIISTHRNYLIITDIDKLALLCSKEILP